MIFETEFFRGSVSAQVVDNCLSARAVPPVPPFRGCFGLFVSKYASSYYYCFLFILLITMSSPVELYVYDLSNGMARQLSAQLTGRQIDGIWYTLLSYYHLHPSLNCTLYRHTSVVVFGKEVFYGQGIDTSLPGRSHVSNHSLKIQL
jgi:hypothetical protein